VAIGIYFNPASMNAAQYDEVINRLDAAGAQASLAGRLHHACSGDKLQVFDIWEPQQAFGKFGETLMPMLRLTGLDPGQPMVEPGHNLIPG
jgi:hypothetical protein